MKYKERNLSNNLKGYFLKEKFFVDKIESRLTTAGIPDLLVVSPNGFEQLIELKVVEADCVLSLTPGQIAWHSKRNMRHCTHPFIILVELRNKLLVVNSKKVLDIIEKGGKIDLDNVPDECWFSRTATDYSMLTYVTTDLFHVSGRVYK